MGRCNKASEKIKNIVENIFLNTMFYFPELHTNMLIYLLCPIRQHHICISQKYNNNGSSCIFLGFFSLDLDFFCQMSLQQPNTIHSHSLNPLFARLPADLVFTKTVTTVSAAVGFYSQSLTGKICKISIEYRQHRQFNRKANNFSNLLETFPPCRKIHTDIYPAFLPSPVSD